MEFLNPKSRRSFAIRLWLGYILCAIAIGFATLILVFMANGYAFDNNKHTVIQNGLVVLDSDPGDAEVILDGNLEKNKTSTKLTIPGGSHSVTIRKAGYNSWMHAFELEGGSVEALNYAKMLPMKPKKTEITTYTDKPVLVSQSTNQKRLLVLPNSKAPIFDVYDLTNMGVPQKVLLPLSAFGLESGSLGTVEVVSWSADATYVVLKHTQSAKTTYVMANISQPENSYNLSTSLSFGVDVLRFDQKAAERLYALTLASGALHSVNVKDKSSSELVAKGVIDFDKQDDSPLVYVTAVDAPLSKVNVRLQQGGDNFLLTSLPAGAASYTVRSEKFGSTWWCAVTHPTESITQLYRSPFDTLKNGGQAEITTTLRLGTGSNLSFSPDGRFVMAQKQNEFALYNFDLSRYYRYRIEAFATGAPTMQWVSNHQIGAITTGGYALYDFDGENPQYVNGGQVPLAAVIAPKFKAAALLETTNSAYVLTNYNLE